MTWLMEIIKVWQEEQFPIKYCVIEHLILLQIRNMMGIKEVLLQWFINSLINTLLVVVLKMKICQTNNWQTYYTNQVLENFKKEKYNGLL